jgi:hypothetical protein
MIAVTPETNELRILFSTIPDPDNADGNWIYDFDNAIWQYSGQAIDLTSLEMLSNKQNNLTPDDSGTKYPTVKAVTEALANKQDNLPDKTGFEGKALLVNEDATGFEYGEAGKVDSVNGIAPSGDTKNVVVTASNINTASTGTVQATLTGLRSDLSTESVDRENADDLLSGDITAEATARDEADTQLQTNINTEIADRENAITQEVEDRDAAILVETTNRETADGTLQTNIETETTNRTVADTALQYNIDHATYIGTYDSFMALTADQRKEYKEAYITGITPVTAGVVNAISPTNSEMRDYVNNTQFTGTAGTETTAKLTTTTTTIAAWFSKIVNAVNGLISSVATLNSRAIVKYLNTGNLTINGNAGITKDIYYSGFSNIPQVVISNYAVNGYGSLRVFISYKSTTQCNIYIWNDAGTAITTSFDVIVAGN